MPKEDSNDSQDPTEDLQAELLRLQRQFRLLEDDRRAYREETEYALQKQRETIKVLNEEHGELAKDNKLAGGTKVQNFDAENTQTLKKLLEEERLTKLAFNEHKVKLENVNHHIEDLLQLSDVQRMQMGGCKESERTTKEMNKMIMVMENRLNEANKKFNAALAENNKMRQEIDDINIQRRKFEDLHRKLTTMFKDKNGERDFLIETATCLFNTRDEAHNRMQSLREKSERDVLQYYSELKDILRVIDHDKKLHEFMTAKTEERSELYEATVQGRKEKMLRDYVKTLQGKVENYEDIFGKLVEVSGMEDVGEMVKKFILVEDENFASFNYIKEQTQSIQSKEASIAAFKHQIDRMSVDETVVDAERKQITERLIQQEKEYSSDYQRLTSCIKEEQEKLDKIALNINNLFDLINCNRAARNGLLCGSKITNTNMLSWVGLIEQRCSELLQAKTLISSRYKAEGVTEPHGEPNTLLLNTIGKMTHFMVNPPSIHSDNTAISDMTPATESSRPISQKETRIMISAKMEKEKKNGESAVKKLL